MVTLDFSQLVAAFLVVVAFIGLAGTRRSPTIFAKVRYLMSLGAFMISALLFLNVIRV